ncbi:hypothetical protein RJ55_00784 [Drechmeria coniospora]|nr:hypothetical protein RJ55_00784 [Drechmeria coniospora]
MFNKAFSAAAVALAASSVVSAQTFSTCNPMKESCPADPAFCAKVDCDLRKGDCEMFKPLKGTTVDHTDKGAVFSIEKDLQGPTLRTPKYIFYGRVDVEVQAAKGQGIVTSVVLQSDDLDEIDWEWVGTNSTNVLSNYFSKGNTSIYDRGKDHPVDDALGRFHTYSIEWTPDALVWLIDNVEVRRLNNVGLFGSSAFPQSPMQLRIGTWVGGGKDTAPDTVKWAGGYTNFDDGPFLGYYKKVTVVDYAGTGKPCQGGVKEYVYSDRSGQSKSINVVGGSDEDTSSESASATATSVESTSSATELAKSSHTSVASEPTSQSTAVARPAGNSTGTHTGTHTGPAPSSTGVYATPSTLPSSGAERGAVFASFFLAVAGVLVAIL